MPALLTSTSTRPSAATTSATAPVDGRRVGDVRRERSRRAAGVGDRGAHVGRTLGVDVDDGDRRARLRETRRDRRAEPARPAGDDRDAVLEAEEARDERRRGARSASGGRHRVHRRDEVVDGRQHLALERASRTGSACPSPRRAPASRGTRRRRPPRPCARRPRSRSRPVSGPSFTTTRRPVFAIDSAIVSASSGLSVRDVDHLELEPVARELPRRLQRERHGRAGGDDRDVACPRA